MLRKHQSFTPNFHGGGGGALNSLKNFEKADKIGLFKSLYCILTMLTIIALIVCLLLPCVQQVQGLSSSTTYYKSGSSFYTLSSSVQHYKCTNSSHSGTNDYTTSSVSGTCYSSNTSYSTAYYSHSCSAVYGSHSSSAVYGDHSWSRGSNIGGSGYWYYWECGYCGKQVDRGITGTGAKPSASTCSSNLTGYKCSKCGTTSSSSLSGTCSSNLTGYKCSYCNSTFSSNSTANCSSRSYRKCSSCKGNWNNCSCKVNHSHSISKSHIVYTYKNVDTGVTTTSQSTFTTATGYTITYNANGGSGTMSTQYFLHGHSQALNSNAYTRTGYSFLGWSTSSTATTATYTNSQAVTSVTSGSSATLYAIWQSNEYQVAYHANGGSGSMANTTHTYGVSSSLRTNAFTRTGYTFKGWSTSADGAVSYADGASVSDLSNSGETINLYAVWQINVYTVSLTANNAQYGTISGAGSYEYGTSVTLTATPQNGYTLSYWTINGSTVVPTGNTYTFTATQNVTAVANFILVNACVSANAGGEVRISQNADGTFTFKAVPYVGYYLNGWLVDGIIYSQKNATYTGMDLTLVDAQNKCINAIFSATNGATPSGGVNPTSGVAVYSQFGGEARMNGYADSDTTIHLSVAFTQKGYKFDGWYIYGEDTALSYELSVDLNKTTIMNKLIVAKFSETNAQLNTETNNTENLT